MLNYNWVFINRILGTIKMYKQKRSPHFDKYCAFKCRNNCKLYFRIYTVFFSEPCVRKRLWIVAWLIMLFVDHANTTWTIPCKIQHNKTEGPSSTEKQLFSIIAGNQHRNFSVDSMSILREIVVWMTDNKTIVYSITKLRLSWWAKWWSDIRVRYKW